MNNSIGKARLYITHLTVYICIVSMIPAINVDLATLCVYPILSDPKQATVSTTITTRGWTTYIPLISRTSVHLAYGGIYFNLYNYAENPPIIYNSINLTLLTRQEAALTRDQICDHRDQPHVGADNLRGPSYVKSDKCSISRSDKISRGRYVLETSWRMAVKQACICGRAVSSEGIGCFRIPVH